MDPVAVIGLLASGAGVISFADTLASKAWTRWRSKQQQAVETAIARAVAKIAVEHLLSPIENKSDANEAAVWLDGKLAPLFELMRDRGLAVRLLAAAETMSGPAIASWQRPATTALDGWPDRRAVHEVFDTEGLLEQLPREIAEALLRLALPGGPLEEWWPDLAGAAERLGALLANGQELPPATPAERATYYWAHLAQVATGMAASTSSLTSAAAVV